MDSKQNTFTLAQRIHTAAEYSRTMSNPEYRLKTNHYLLLASPNEQEFGRLGLIIGKKVSKKAVIRNKYKRIIRESFRQDSISKLPINVVVLGRSSLDSLSKSEFRHLLKQSWAKLQRLCQK